MKTISSKNIILKMDKDNFPVYFMESGESVRVETLDCYANQFHEGGDPETVKASNPATGPIFLNSARAGDTLKITIERIELESKGVVRLTKGNDVLGSRIEKKNLKVIDILDDYATYDDIKIPLKPMIGVIGVAPKNEGISNFAPGSHGGNMDCKEIKENSVVYLPIFQDGALLSLGDLHAAMGDGEIGNSGLETSGVVQIRVQVRENIKINNPVVISDDRLYCIASNENLDAAIDEVMTNMLDILVKDENMKEVDAIRLMTLVTDLGICQIVNPLKTVKLSIPLEYLKNSKF